MAWRRVLNELIETGNFRTQRELARAVEKRVGRRLNQASISRELHALGARKVDGVYRLGPDMDLSAHVHSWASTAGGCLLVLRTDVAFASVVAQLVDTSGIEGALGTIAGDDTVFVALAGPADQLLVLELLGLRPRT